MSYAKHLSIVRRKLKIKKDLVNDEAQMFAIKLAQRLGLHGFARFLKNNFVIELEGNEVLVQEYIQSFVGRMELRAEDGFFDIETMSLVGEKSFELRGIDSKK